ncbi:MAG: PEP-CTERM sorting domain-containing protein [Verrucomicrobiota bacterium]
MMKLHLLFIPCCLALISPGMAGSIDWGSAVADELYTAGGTAIPGTYQFELGTFETGFIPDATNTALWEGNWRLIEQADFNAPLQYVAENSILTTSGPNLIWERDQTGDESAPLSNPLLFSPGEQVYVWAFSGKTIDSTTQWALVTGNGSTQDTDWQLTAGLGDPAATTRAWRLSNADTAIFGGLNDLQGAGTFGSSPASFTLQTALVMAPIPEPGITVMLAVGVALSLCRRRRS